MPDRKFHIARRMDGIAPFHVMDLLAKARQMEQAGQSVIHMEVGEPDFATARPIVEAGQQALEEGLTHYTQAIGLGELRQSIADFYRQQFDVAVDPESVVLTPGASGALQLILGVLLDAGDEVMMADPGYPCNRHIVRQYGGEPVMVPVGAETAYQLTPELLDTYGSDRTRVVMVASPSNPTGAVLSREEITALWQWATARGALLLVDEIYQQLVYDIMPETALSVADDIIVVNSFSKYFGMTGWRLGWLIAPPSLVEPVDRLAQNIFLSPATVSQWAAMAAFKPQTIAILEQRRELFKQRRDYLLPALSSLGFEIRRVPEGAFYLYADSTRFSNDSFTLCQDILQQTGVAITPGRDFGEHLASSHVRFAYTTGQENLEEGIRRLHEYLG